MGTDKHEICVAVYVFLWERKKTEDSIEQTRVKLTFGVNVNGGLFLPVTVENWRTVRC